MLGARMGWGNSAGVGSIVGGGVNSESSTFKNRPSHHKYKSSKQFELKGSKST